MLCLRNARAFPLLPAALASVSFGFVSVQVRVIFREYEPKSDFCCTYPSVKIITQVPRFAITITDDQSANLDLFAPALPN